MKLRHKQLWDEQDQTANSEQVGHCGLEKGQFILVNRWSFKLDIECFWGTEVYQCPCPTGSELIPFDTVDVVSRIKSQAHLYTAPAPPFGGSKVITIQGKSERSPPTLTVA